MAVYVDLVVASASSSTRRASSKLQQQQQQQQSAACCKDIRLFSDIQAEQHDELTHQWQLSGTDLGTCCCKPTCILTSLLLQNAIDDVAPQERGTAGLLMVSVVA
jgi:hypothetical protein